MAKLQKSKIESGFKYLIMFVKGGGRARNPRDWNLPPWSQCALRYQSLEKSLSRSRIHDSSRNGCSQIHFKNHPTHLASGRFIFLFTMGKIKNLIAVIAV